MPIWTSYGALYITSNVSLTHLGLYGLLSELTPLLHWFPDIPASLYMYINQINVISEQQSETEVLDAHDLELVDCWPNVGSRHEPDVRDIKMPEVNAGAYIVAKIVVL